MGITQAVMLRAGPQDLAASPLSMNRAPQSAYSNPVFSALSPVPGLPTIPPVLHPPPAPAPAPAHGPAPAPATGHPAAPPPAAGAPHPPAAPLSAINNFANSAGMQFALQQGANALNNLYAAHGEIQSGAAAKALQSFGQQTALQDYFMPYMNYLTGQQAMGAQAASSLAGVGSSFGNTAGGMGQNFANAATGINQNTGNALSNGATNIGNANANQAIIGGLANANLGSAIGSGLGSLGSSFFAPSSSSFSPVNFSNIPMTGFGG